MRIVHYYHPALRGEAGVQIAVRGWCEALADVGADVTLLAGTADGSVPLPAGVRVETLPDTPRAIPPPGSLRRHIAGADLLVVHGGWDVRNLVAARDARRAGVPYVVTPHGVYYPQVFARRKVALKRAWWGTLERPFLRRALGVHVFFDAEIDHLRTRGVRTPTVVAPNGFVRPGGVTWSPEPGGPLVWLGRLDPYHKGLDILLRAVALLAPSDRPRIRLYSRPWRDNEVALRALADRLGLKGSVTVEPPVYGAAKWETLAGAAGFLYPSRWDASPISVVEAVSIGLPALLTRFPLARFLVERGGAIGAEADERSLGAGIRTLLSSDAKEIGQQGAEVIEKELSWGRVARAWLDHVTHLLDARGPDRPPAR